VLSAIKVRRITHPKWPTYIASYIRERCFYCDLDSFKRILYQHSNFSVEYVQIQNFIKINTINKSIALTQKIP